MTESGALQEFSIPSAPGVVPGTYGAPAPRNIVAGPDGAMWFTDPGDQSIGRITMSGAISEYPITSSKPAVPDEIVSYGSELWFSEDGLADLGSVNPSASSPPPPPLTKPKAASTRHTTVVRNVRPIRSGVRAGGDIMHVALAASTHHAVGDGARSRRPLGPDSRRSSWF